MIRRALGGIKSLAKNVLVFGAALGVTALGVELAVALLSPQQLIEDHSEIWTPVDTLGWNHKPFVNSRVNTGERTVGIFTDQNGFRVGRPVVEGDGLDESVTDGFPRVLVLGDSFMAAFQVEYEQSLSGLMAAALGKQYPGAVVHNAGVDGWGPRQYYYRAHQLIKPDEYDLVVLALFVENDIIPIPIEPLYPFDLTPNKPFRLPRDFTMSEVVSALVRPLNNMLETRSHAFILTRRKLQALLHATGIIPFDFPYEFLTSEASASRWGLTTQMAVDIEGLAEKTGAETLVVLIPANFQMDGVAFDGLVERMAGRAVEGDVDQPNRIMSDSLLARGLNVVDLLGPFRKETARGAVLYGTIDAHLSPDGHRSAWSHIEASVRLLTETPKGSP